MAGEITYTDWIDGEPITGPASDGSFTEWIDGEPVIRYEDSATLLVIPDADHLHAADNLTLNTSTNWRIQIARNDGDGSYLSIREVELRGSVGGADQCSGGIATASASHSAPFDPSMAFDDDTGTKWATPTGTLSGWLQYLFDSAVDVAQYSIDPDTDYDRAPNSWMLERFDTGLSDWVPVDARINETGWSGARTYTRSIPAEGTVWRLNISAVGTAATRTVIQEMEMRESAGGADVCTAANGFAYAHYVYNEDYVSFAPAKAFDGTNLHWVSTDDLPERLYYCFSSEKDIVQYTIQARRNDTGDLNSTPKAWTLEKWTGSAWEVVDTQSDQTGWSYNEVRTYTVSQTGTNLVIPDAYHLHDADNVVVTTTTFYITDFSDQTIGLAPSDWTEEYVTTNGELVIVSSAFIGSKSMHVNGTSYATYVASWDDVPDLTDVEILALAKPGMKTSVHNFGFVVRGSGSSGSENNYFLRTFNDDRTYLNKYVNGTATQLNYDETDSPALYDNTSHYWFRFSVIGTALKAKVWKYGDEEPAAWLVEDTDSDISGSGFVGVHSRAGTFTDPEVAWIGVSSDGTTVPMPDLPTDLVIPDAYHLLVDNAEINPVLNVSTDTYSAWDSTYGAASNVGDGNTGTYWQDNPGATTEFWFQVQLATAGICNKIRLYGRVSLAGRLPRDFTVKGSNNGSDWATIAIRAVYDPDALPAASSWAEVNFANSVSYSYYRLEWTEQFDGTENYTAIAEVRLIYDPGNLSITTRSRLNPPSDTHSAWDSTYGVASNAADAKLSTYWQSDTATGSSWFQVQSATAGICTEIRLYQSQTTRSGRMPGSPTIKGSNNGSDWTTIASSMSYAVAPAEATWAVLTFSNSNPYTYYKLEWADQYETAQTYDAIGEIEFIGSFPEDTALVIPDAAHLHDADNVALTQVHDLVVAACDNLHYADNVALVELLDLTVAEAYNEIIDDGPIAIQTGLTLVMAEAYHDLVDEGPLALTQEHTLTVAECDHLQEADSIVLTALHILTVAECYHVHAPPNLTLVQHATLTVQESDHTLTSPNISLGTDVSLLNLDSYHVLTDDFDYLRSPDVTLVLLEKGAASSGGIGYSAGTYRMPFNVAAAFPQHQKIRFQISADQTHSTSTLVSASFGYRASGDTTTDTPVALTFTGKSLPYTMAAGETFWSDWFDFVPGTASEILVSLWFDDTHYPGYWSDGNTRYWGGGGGDQTLVINMSTFMTQSNTWYVRSIEVTKGELSINEGVHVTTSDNIDFNQHFLATAETYHTMASDSVELSLTAWVNEEPWVYDTSAAARNYRMIMPASILDYEGQYVRVKIECHDTDSVSMDGMSIGRRKAAADAFDYDDSTVTPVRFTFAGGSNDVTVGAGESKWSDWVPFALDPAQDHLVHCHLNGPHKFAYNTVLDCYRKNASTDETMISDVKSYTLVDEFFYLVKLEVRVRSVMAGFDDAVHLHTADNLALGVHLTVDDAFHLHEADAIPALTGTHNLTLAACDHLHDADALTLTQEHTLALADDTLLHEADTLNLAGTNVLAVADSDHLHTADAANLIVILSVDETYHEHTAPNLTIVSGFDLEIPETVILTVSDNIAGMTVSMTVASSYHDHLADTLAITADHFLTTAETYHLHTADSLNTYMTGDLPVQSAHHEIQSDELTLGFSVTLTVREAYHRHFVDTLALTQEHTLAMPDGDSYHDHFADNIDIPALPEGLERTFINSLTVQRTMWSLTRRLTIEGRAA